MTICIPIKGNTFEDIQERISQAETKADMLEFRIDLWGNSIDIKKAMELTSLPIILTVRSEAHGGKFKGTQKEYFEKIQELAKLKPNLLDVEFGNPIPDYPSDKIILSFHECDKPIEDIPLLITAMRKTPAALYKVAMLCNSTLDALRLLNALKGKDTVAIGMGYYGQFSRLLQPIYCSGLTFAVVHVEDTVAPGQFSVHEMANIYHYKKLNPQTHVYGLIGDPVDKSLGHIIHNKAFAHYDINAVYVKMNVKPEELPDFFCYAKSLNFKGLSVTMPLKEKVLPFIDEISPAVKEIKALNTITFLNGKLKGQNCDGYGALQAIEKIKPVKGTRFVLIGAGGAAKAIAYEAQKRGAHVKMLSRSLNNLGDVHQGYDILINATPAPMPIPACAFKPDSVVMDIVTFPRITEFLHHAALSNCICVYGYQMWINQACCQWKEWFPNKNTKGLLDFLTEAYESLLE